VTLDFLNRAGGQVWDRVDKRDYINKIKQLRFSSNKHTKASVNG